MKCRSTFFNLHVKFIFLIFLFLIFLKEIPAYPVSSTFVILPFSSDSVLTELRNNLTDSLIENLKQRGFNAIGTRYLTSILKLESCNSDECVKKVATIVGARYTIYGTLSGDTLTFNVSFHLKDINEDKQLISTNKMIVGGIKALSQLSKSLSSLVSQAIQDSNTISDTTKPDSIKQEVILSNSDTQITIIDHNTLKKADSSNIADSFISPADTFDLKDSCTTDSSISDLSKESTDTLNYDTLQPNKIESLPELIYNNDKALTKDTLAGRLQYPQNTYEPFPIKKKSLFKPLPTGLKQQGYRGTRLLVFGNLAAAGFISGLIVNDRVKKSLDKETELYEIHRNSTEADNATSYNKYINQTEKTDRYSKIRNALYATSGILALGFSISVFF